MVEDTNEPGSWLRLNLRETGVSYRRIRANVLAVWFLFFQFGLRGAGIWFRFSVSVDYILVLGVVIIDKSDVAKLLIFTTVSPSTSNWS